METTVIKKPAYNLKDGIRLPGDGLIRKANVEEMIAAVQADTIRLMSTASDKLFVHLLNSSTGAYFPIGLGPSVKTDKTGDELIKELFSNYSVFTGTFSRTEDDGTVKEGVWFRFGTANTNEPLLTISLEELKLKYYSGS